MEHIPFQLPDSGLIEHTGTIHLDSDYLVLELETSLLGLMDKETQIVKIEPSALQEIRFDPGFIRDRLILRPKKDTLLKALPGDFLEEVVLTMWNTCRTQAEELTEQVRARSTAEGQE